MSVTQASAQLRTLAQHLSGAERRGSVLDILQRVASAHSVSFLKFQGADRAIADLTVVGETAICDAIQSNTKSVLEISEVVSRRTNVSSCTFYGWKEELSQIRTPFDSDHERFLGGSGVYDFAGTAFYRGIEPFGVVCCYRSPQHGFSKKELSRLEPLIPDITQQLLFADHSDYERTSTVFFVLTSDLTLTHASEGGERWLTDFRRRWLQGVLTQTSASALALGVCAMLDSFEIQARFLGGLATDQEKRFGCYLVTVETTQRDPRLALPTSREIQVAEHAIYGATNTEIASELGISAETVKTHLKQIYSKLEVSNRVELTQTLGNAIKP